MLSQILREIAAEPESRLAEVCPLALGSFLAGYRCADEGIAVVQRGLHAFVDACPSEIGPYGALFLREPDRRRGLTMALEAIDAVIAQHGELVQAPSRFAEWEWVDFFRDGRPGMYVGDVNAMSVADFVSGFHCAQSMVRPELGRLHGERLSDFERYLRTKNSAGAVAWWRIVRVYVGLCDVAKGVVALWDQFIADGGHNPKPGRCQGA